MLKIKYLIIKVLFILIPLQLFAQSPSYMTPIIAYLLSDSEDARFTRDDTLQKEIVSDSLTGLMWQDFSHTTSWFNYYEYDVGIAQCEAYNSSSHPNYSGHTDWRLPTIEELETIVDTTNSPAIYSIFENVEGEYGADYWTGEISYNDPEYEMAYFIDFSDGRTSELLTSNRSAYGRCVRRYGPDNSTFDYSGTWGGIVNVSLVDEVGYCSWNVNFDISSDNTATISATLTGTNLSGECDSYVSGSATINHSDNSGLTFTVSNSTADNIFGGSTFNLSRDYKTLTESKNSTLYGYRILRITTLNKR